MSIDWLFDILKTEDAGAVKLFSRWLNDYFRQVAKLTLGPVDVPDLVDYDPEEARPMLAENLTNWFKKAYEDGKRDGFREGFQEGFREGYGKSVSLYGIEKGSRESTRRFLLQMLKRGLPMEEVAAIAEMNADDVRALIV